MIISSVRNRPDLAGKRTKAVIMAARAGRGPG
jgi:hypothetical protein